MIEFEVKSKKQHILVNIRDRPKTNTVCSPCACHSTSLCRLRCAVVAAESLTIYVVVIVLTVIR